MSKLRAIDGDYADFKLVRTRKVCQVVVEFPIERAAEVTELIGWPKPGGNVRCAVALLGDAPTSDDGAAPARKAAARASAESPANLSPVARKAKGEYMPPGWADMKPAARAAVLCKMPEFWRYMGEIMEPEGVWDEPGTTAVLKTLCGVTSRAEIVEGSRAAAELSRIIGAFHAWRDYKDSVR